MARDTSPDEAPDKAADEQPTQESTFDPEEGIEPPLSSEAGDPLSPGEAAASETGDGGIPGYVLALVVLMLAVAAGGVVALRRFRAGS